MHVSVRYSGAGTNLKVAGTGPEQKWGHRSKKNFWSCPPLFWF